MGLQSLQPVVVDDSAARANVAGRQVVEFKFWKYGRLRLLPEIDPDHSSGFARRKVLDAHAGFEGFAAVHGLARHINQFSVHVDLPAVEDAAKRVLFVAGERERCTAMWTRLVQEADLPTSAAECNEVLAH